MSVWVVKLGGSLANSEKLPKWLEVIATAGAGKVVLVPGGGPWADEVRVAQKREGFDDGVAHRKALRSMERYALALSDLRADLNPAASEAEIREVLRTGKVALWMPHDMVLADPFIPQSWDVTSDSLAAWLAGKLGASALLMVKSVVLGGSHTDVEEWSRRGWVDSAFKKFSSGARFRIHMLGQRDQETARRMLVGDGEG
jgi:5-(aminomethyl)-3-furanmethanol phosphate kinase